MTKYVKGSDGKKMNQKFVKILFTMNYLAQSEWHNLLTFKIHTVCSEMLSPLSLSTIRITLE